MDDLPEDRLQPYDEIAPEEDAMITAMIEQHNRDIAERQGELGARRGPLPRTLGSLDRVAR